MERGDGQDEEAVVAEEKEFLPLAKKVGKKKIHCLATAKDQFSRVSISGKIEWLLVLT